MASIFPKDTVRNVAESIGIAELKDEVVTAVAQDVEYRITEIIQDSVKFMRHSKRTRLTVDDINNALRLRNVEPVYGFVSPESTQFKKLVATIGQNTGTMYYMEDEELDLDSVLSKPLPKVPLDVAFTAHWLAIEGVQPAIAQNPAPDDAKLPRSKRAVPGATSGVTEIEVKPLVKHVLSKELQVYYTKITDAILGAGEESDDAEDIRDGGREALRLQALESLRQDPGLHQLVPYFAQFVAEKVTQNMRKLRVLRAMLQMVKALLDNPHVFIEPYLHQLMPTILSCLVARRICENPRTQDHWSVRQLAATLIATICSRYGDAYHTLQPRVTKTLLRAFLDPAKPFTSQYGAIIGLTALGHEVQRVLLCPNLLAYGALLEPVLSSRDGMEDESADGADKMDGEKSGPKIEAERCFEALMNAIREFLRVELDSDASVKLSGNSKPAQPDSVSVRNEEKKKPEQMEEDLEPALVDELRGRVGNLFAEAILREFPESRAVEILLNAVPK
ncbi:uncharacterized protein VTP21DRAFT_10215 [Calcarisporiella thermophila]|uniref:uncharacterized protein n=1 Tax=Calcarisporiella thermophila TaxID=911321 RepID=UPI0037434810